MTGKINDPQFHGQRARDAGRASGAARQRKSQQLALAQHVEEVVLRSPELTATQLAALRAVLGSAISDEQPHLPKAS